MDLETIKSHPTNILAIFHPKVIIGQLYHVWSCVFEKKTTKKNGVLKEIWTLEDSNETIVDLKNSEFILLKKIQCTTLLNT
jgi:hypothetical protein